MRSFVLPAIVATLVALLANSARGDDPSDGFRVGSAGDVMRMEIRGAKTFQPEQIRRALAWHLPTFLASHPHKPLTTFGDAVGEAILAGHQRAGFAECRVEVTPRLGSRSLAATIDEGPRYRAGRITVLCEDEPIKRLLIECLAKPQTQKKEPPQSAAEAAKRQDGRNQKSDPPLWPSGQPAPCDTIALQQMQREVGRALLQAGYYDAVLDLRLQTRGGGGQVDLIVEVESLGPRAVIERILVTGLKKNSEQDVLKLLELHPPLSPSPELVGRIERQLDEAARFWSRDVKLGPINKRTGAMSLWIEVDEYEPAPKLNEPFSEKEQALLRLGQWLSRFPERDEDLQIEGQLEIEQYRGQFCLTLAPRGGVVLRCNGQLAKSGRLDHALLQRSNRVALYSFQTGAKVESDRGLEFQPSIGLAIYPKRRESRWSGFTSMFNYNVGASTLPAGEDARALVPSIDLRPVCFIREASREPYETSLQDGVLTLRGKSNLLKIERDTGRLLQWQVDAAPHGKLQLRCGKGLLAAATADLQRSTAELRDLTRPGAPLASLGAMAWEELMLHRSRSSQLTEAQQRQAAVLRELLVERLLEPLDQAMFEKRRQSPDERFEIPAAWQGPGADQGVAGGLALAIAMATNSLVPSNGWAWTLGREVGFVVLGNREHTDQALLSVYQSPRTGPVGFLTTAWLLSAANLKPAAASFASRGLERLDADSFRADCQLLLAEDAPLRPRLIEVAEAMRGWSDEEASAAADLLPAKSGKLLRAFAAELRRDPQSPTPQALDRAVAVLWTAGLRAEVERSLRALLGHE